MFPCHKGIVDFSFWLNYNSFSADRKHIGEAFEYSFEKILCEIGGMFRKVSQLMSSAHSLCCVQKTMTSSTFAVVLSIVECYCCMKRIDTREEVGKQCFLFAYSVFIRTSTSLRASAKLIDSAHSLTSVSAEHLFCAARALV